jgi:glycine/sarcosine/betaine reductase complex component A
MDLDDQANVNRLAESDDKDQMVVILGQPDPISSALFAETVTRGDPTWAGPLAGVPLGLPVYHILEPEIREGMDPDLYQEHVGLMELSAEVDEIIKWVKFYREGGGDEAPS